LKSLDHGFGRIGGEFDLDGPALPGPVEQEVGLDPIRYAEKIGLGVQTEETQAGEDLFDHETFPTVTDQRLIVEMFDILHIQEGVEQTAVGFDAHYFAGTMRGYWSLRSCATKVFFAD